MVVWTVSAVVALGLGVASSVLTPPTSISQARAKLTAAELVQVADRAPASAGPEFSALALDDRGTQALDFTLPCEGSEGRFAKSVVQIRLSGSLCAPGKATGKSKFAALESSEITNITNGFSATVFYPKSNAFTTDYLTLAPGRNQIRILHQMKSGGRVERDFVIERL